MDGRSPRGTFWSPPSSPRPLEPIAWLCAASVGLQVWLACLCLPYLNMLLFGPSGTALRRNAFQNFVVFCAVGGLLGLVGLRASARRSEPAMMLVGIALMLAGTVLTAGTMGALEGLSSRSPEVGDVLELALMFPLIGATFVMLHAWWFLIPVGLLIGLELAWLRRYGVALPKSKWAAR